jgi:peptidoglycan/LPS O-acetylase OafA/YrhL
LLVEGKYAGWLTPYFQLAHIGFAVLMAPYAMATVRKIPAKTSIFRWLDRDFGNLTYEVYLFHESLLLVAWHYVSGLPRLQQVPGLLLVAVGILPVSYVFYRLIAMPIDRRRKAYLKSQQRLAGAPPAAETGALANQA